MKIFYINSLFICSCIVNLTCASPMPSIASGTSAKAYNNTSQNNKIVLQIRSTTIQSEKNNTTKYSGNVQISKGTLVITADTAILQNKQNTIIISGKPAKFIDLVSIKEQINATAQTINFDSNTNKIILKGHASISKDGKTETDKQYITYDLNTHNYKL